VFATLKLSKVNAGRTSKDWHGLTVITTALTGVPEHEVGHLLSDWREARSEERQAAVAAMRLGFIPRRTYVRTQEVPRHRRRDRAPGQQRRGNLGMLTASRNSGFEGSEDQIRNLQAFKNLLTAARRGGKIDMSLPEPQIRGLQAEENLLTAARNAGKIYMSLP